MDRGAWWATVHEVTESDTTDRRSTAQSPGLGTPVAMETQPQGLLATPVSTVASRQPNSSAHSGDEDLSICDTGDLPVVQGLRICLAMQGLQVQSLVWKIRSHTLQGNEACEPQLLEPEPSRASAPQQEKPPPREAHAPQPGRSPTHGNWDKPRSGEEDPAQP